MIVCCEHRLIRVKPGPRWMWWLPTTAIRCATCDLYVPRPVD